MEYEKNKGKQEPKTLDDYERKIGILLKKDELKKALRIAKKDAGYEDKDKSEPGLIGETDYELAIRKELMSANLFSKKGDLGVALNRIKTGMTELNAWYKRERFARNDPKNNPKFAKVAATLANAAELYVKKIANSKDPQDKLTYLDAKDMIYSIKAVRDKYLKVGKKDVIKKARELQQTEVHHPRGR